LIIKDENFTNISLGVNKSFNTDFGNVFLTHPNVDKNSFSKGILCLKDTKKSFPVDMEIKLLQWKFKKNNEDLLPLKVSCWPSKTNKGWSCVVEFSVRNANVLPLQNISIEIPYPNGSDVNIDEIGIGDYKIQDQKIYWLISSVESSVDGYNFEFNITKGSSSCFFPVVINYSSEKTISNLFVDEVHLNYNNKTSVNFVQENVFESLNCKIE